VACKDNVREAKSRDLINKHVHPKIMDEEFKDYQNLLDGMEVDPTPTILPCLPLLGPTHVVSGQNKRAGTFDNNGEEETWDTVASGSGTHPAGTTGGVDQLPAQPATLGAVTGEPVIQQIGGNPDLSRRSPSLGAYNT